jgi:hypothetical protein
VRVLQALERKNFGRTRIVPYLRRNFRRARIIPYLSWCFVELLYELAYHGILDEWAMQREGPANARGE